MLRQPIARSVARRHGRVRADELKNRRIDESRTEVIMRSASRMLLVLIVMSTFFMRASGGADARRSVSRFAHAVSRPLHGALGRPGRAGLDWFRAVGRPGRPPGCSYPAKRSARRNDVEGDTCRGTRRRDLGIRYQSQALSQCRTDPRRQETVGWRALLSARSRPEHAANQGESGISG